jgi:GH15 family glucan-1,4-alpha-glucosidase
VPADDTRHRATVDAVARDLSVDHYVFRFRHAPGRLNDSEGAFLLSGFHMAMATHQLGDRVGAVRWFERSRGAVGPPDLFTEEFDVVQRQLRGNLPQAFVHALLMEAATYLARPPEDR